MKTTRLPGQLAVLFSLALAACNSDKTEPTADTAAAVNDLADRYYAYRLERTPEEAYFAAVDIDRHDGLFDNGPEAYAAAEAREDTFLAELESIDFAALAGRAEWITAVFLDQQLRGDRARRVCRHELWNVNQMAGWQLGYVQVAGLQPVASEQQRQQALTRWSAFAAFIDQEVENLERGLSLGYSAPKSVVVRVIEQVDGMLRSAPELSPFMGPGYEGDDGAFASAMLDIVQDSINPALARYRDYLAGPYMQRARDELSVTTNPDGRECYEASLFYYTTLERSGEEVYALGQATVAQNRDRVVELGQQTYELDDFASIVNAAKADPADGFTGRDELLSFSQTTVERAEAEMPNWVATMPQQAVAVVPFPEHEEGTGRSAHYRAGNDERPGEYRIPLYRAERQSRGNAEATAFHETWPGHHLQVASAQAVDGLHPINDIVWFSGPGEGWARYSEALAEEMGLYTTTTGLILRRAWPARGMVVDPGIHLFGWSREQAAQYLEESGRFPASQTNAVIDRIAILPGQLTAYDSGGLEIVALRRAAESALGEQFDIREFHDRVLENGTIPLEYLRRHVEAWIEESTRN